MEWQPIETAPRDGTRVELMGKNGKLDAGYWYEYSEQVDAAFRKANNIPAEETGEFNTDKGEGPHTHWRPMPEAPNASAKGRAESASSD